MWKEQERTWINLLLTRLTTCNEAKLPILWSQSQPLSPACCMWSQALETRCMSGEFVKERYKLLPLPECLQISKISFESRKNMWSLTFEWKNMCFLDSQFSAAWQEAVRRVSFCSCICALFQAWKCKIQKQEWQLNCLFFWLALSREWGKEGIPHLDSVNLMLQMWPLARQSLLALTI